MNKIFTIPNFVTFLRILSVPYMIYLLIINNGAIFKWVLLFALISDILDGLIARIFKMGSDFGASLDAIADLLMYFCALAGLIVFKIDFLKEYFILLSLVFGLFFITRVINFIILKKPFNSYHSYLSKLMAYLQGLFIMTLFFFGFIPFIFYPALYIGILSCVEEIFIIFILKKDQPNIKGLFWIMKK